MKQKVSDILKRSWTFQKATGFDAAKLDVYLSSNNASMHPHAVISSILGVSGGPIFFNVFYNVFIHASQDELRNEAKVSAYHLYKNEKTKTKDAGLISYSDLIKRQYDAEAESLRLYPSKGNNADKDYGSSANMKIKFANGYISITDSASEVKMTGLMNFIF
jgi:hypothetical protein